MASRWKRGASRNKATARWSIFMSPYELTAVAFSLACVLLALREHVLTWPAGLIGVTAYFLVFRDARLYADMVLQVIFFAQGVYGWAYWSRRRRGALMSDSRDSKRVPIRRLSARGRFVTLVAICVFALVAGSALAQWTDASAPYVDSTLSTLSLVANALLTRKLIENWIAWVVADVGYVGLFLSKGLGLSAALYVLFLALAVAGWLRWQREMRVRPP